MYDLANIISALSRISLDIDLTTSEVSNISCDNFDGVALRVQQELQEAKVIHIEDLDLLSAPPRETGWHRSLLAAEKT